MLYLIRKKDKEKVLKTRKVLTMKKSSMIALVSYLTAASNLPAEIAEVRDELTAELTRNAEKAQANRDMYSAAHDVVIAHMSAAPQTVAEIFEACEDELPEGFSKGKVQYALLNYWNSEVVKVENPKSANQYRLA